MGKIISVANQKGGVGKTTTTVNLATILAKRGKKVLLIDADPQGNATSGLGLDKDLEPSTYDILVNDTELEDAMQKTVIKNLKVCPANMNLAGAEVELVSMMSREQRLKEKVDIIKGKFDYILIDCPPSLGLVTLNAFTASDSVLIPVQCEYFALEGLGQLLNTINILKLLLDEYDILIIGIEDKFTKDMLPITTKKKIIATLSIGLDHIDRAFLENDNIKIINCQNSNVVSVAEHIFALILALKKRILEANDISLKGENRRKLSMRSNDITSSTLGIIGAGKISREVIRISKAFNMNIISNTLNPELHEDLMKQGVKFVSLDEVLSNADIITINIPLNEENRNIISKEKIRLMKKTTTFINTSRGELVDMNELINYADENKTFNVGLDIDAENYKDILSIKRNNVIVTPHIAGVTKEAVERMDVEVANRLVEYIKK